MRALTVGGQGNLGGSKRMTDKGVMNDSGANSLCTVYREW